MSDRFMVVSGVCLAEICMTSGRCDVMMLWRCCWDVITLDAIMKLD